MPTFFNYFQRSAHSVLANSSAIYRAMILALAMLFSLSANAINVTGTVKEITESSGHLVTDLGMNSVAVGQSYTYSYSFDAPSVFSTIVLPTDPQFTNHAIFDSNALVTAEIAGSGVGALDNINGFFDFAITNDYVGPPFAGQDIYSVTSQIYQGVGYRLFLSFAFVDYDGTRLNDENFFIETALQDWDFNGIQITRIDDGTFDRTILLTANNAVPLPASIWFFASAFGGLLCWRRNKRL